MNVSRVTAKQQLSGYRSQIILRLAQAQSSQSVHQSCHHPTTVTTTHFPHSNVALVTIKLKLSAALFLMHHQVNHLIRQRHSLAVGGAASLLTPSSDSSRLPRSPERWLDTWHTGPTQTKLVFIQSSRLLVLRDAWFIWALIRRVLCRAKSFHLGPGPIKH